MISSSYADLFAARITDSKVEIIPGAGHIPRVEQTDATYARVRSFLD